MIWLMRRPGPALAAYYRGGLDALVAASSTNPYHAGVPFIWCFWNSLIGSRATQASLDEK